MLKDWETEIYNQFILADEFKIKPWESNLDGEHYPEDLSNIIALKRMQGEAIQHERNKTALQQTISR